MTRHLLHILLAASAALASFPAAQAKNVLDISSDITDSNIIYPESFENDTRKMLEGWYMKNYAATDDRYRRLGDVPTDDATIRKRLGALPVVIEMPFNSIVRNYIDRYTARGREQVAVLLGLSNYYMPIFEQALEENGLPLELKYLPVVESGLDPNAVSRHGAAGLWQFMLNTARGLDMEVNSLVDERRDPYVSSQKAARYLKDLYASYGDWSLAIAAYNCGPGTVNKALRRAGGDPASHDFWSIYYFLPSETRGYVPGFIAANYVMNYYANHNISPVLQTKPLVTDTLMIDDRIHLDQISGVLDIPVEELRILNPQFRADIIPGSADHPYTLILPSVQCQAYLMSHDDILAYKADQYARRLEVEPGDAPSEKLAATIEQERIDDTPLEASGRYSQPSSPRPAKGDDSEAGIFSHKVTPGQTLAQIASMYDVTVDDLKRWNNLTRSSIRTGQMLRVTTTRELAEQGGAREISSDNSPRSGADWSKPATNNNANRNTADNRKKNNKDSKKSAPAPKNSSHTVKSGENLTVIAKKYGVSVADLKKANGMSGDALRPGDKLTVPAKSASSSVTSKKSSASKSGKTSKKSSTKKSSSKKRKR